MLPTLVYNLLMMIVTAGALLSCRKKLCRNKTGPWVCAALLAIACVVAVMFAIVIAKFSGYDLFMVARLFAYGIFLWGFVLLSGMAIFLWRGGRKSSVTCAVLALVLEAIALDAFLLEPHWLEVSYVEMTSSKVQRPLRLVIVADLQTDEIGSYERDVLDRVMKLKPDVILLAGDYLQEDNAQRWQKLRDELHDYLSQIGFKAPLGIYVVEGNTDSLEWATIFQGLPVNVAEETQIFQQEFLQVTCLSMRDSFNTRMRVDAVDRFHVVLGHAPDFALGNIDADLLVAGHTHGGQVQIPFFGPLITLSRVPRRWASGVTELPQERTLIVSRGIGMERRSAPRLRFFCRPELVVVDVKPKTTDGG